MLRRALLAILVACPLVCLAAPPAAPAPPAPPQIPEVLEPLRARIGEKRFEVGGMFKPILYLTAFQPLSDEQWAAIEQLGVRGFYLAGPGFGDAAMPRLAKLDPTELMLWDMPMTDAGAGHLASMKSLRALTFVHAGEKITPKTAHTVENHPALELLLMPIEWFKDKPTFTRVVQSCKRLKGMAFGHFGGDDYCKLFEHHPGIEDLWFWPDWCACFTDAGLVSVSTLPSLKSLRLEYSRVTYDGGLRHLKQAAALESLQLLNMLISEADLARLKADLPQVKITFTPMKPEHLVKLERYEAVRDMPEPLKAAKIMLLPDPVDAARTMLVFPGSGTVTPGLWEATGPLRTRFKIRAFQLQGQAGDDAAVARLVPLDPTTLVLGGGPVTDAGLSHVAAMQSLRKLDLSRCGAITPAAAAVVTNHPAIEQLVPPASWGDDPRVLAAVLANPRLKVISLGQRQASDEMCAVVARHPAVEELSLSAYGTAGLSDRGIESLATIPKLRKLELSHAHFTYDGGLSHLAKLSALETLTLSGVDVAAADIKRLKDALPKLQVRFTPMDAAYRSRWEKLVAARTRALELAKLPEAERAAGLAELQRGDPEAFKGVQAELKGLLPAGKEAP